jgi:hypothetical protein
MLRLAHAENCNIRNSKLMPLEIPLSEVPKLRIFVVEYLMLFIANLCVTPKLKTVNLNCIK